MGALGSLKRRLQLPANLDDLGRNPQQGGGDLPQPPSGFVFITRDGAYVTRNGSYLVKAA